MSDDSWYWAGNVLPSVSGGFDYGHYNGNQYNAYASNAEPQTNYIRSYRPSSGSYGVNVLTFVNSISLNGGDTLCALLEVNGSDVLVNKTVTNPHTGYVMITYNNNNGSDGGFFLLYANPKTDFYTNNIVVLTHYTYADLNNGGDVKIKQIWVE